MGCLVFPSILAQAMQFCFLILCHLLNYANNYIATIKSGIIQHIAQWMSTATSPNHHLMSAWWMPAHCPLITCTKSLQKHKCPLLCFSCDLVLACFGFHFHTKFQSVISWSILEGDMPNTTHLATPHLHTHWSPTQWPKCDTVNNLAVQFQTLRKDLAWINNYSMYLWQVI